MDRQTIGRMDKQMDDLITRYLRWTFWTGGIKMVNLEFMVFQ